MPKIRSILVLIAILSFTFCLNSGKNLNFLNKNFILNYLNHIFEKEVSLVKKVISKSLSINNHAHLNSNERTNLTQKSNLKSLQSKLELKETISETKKENLNQTIPIINTQKPIKKKIQSNILIKVPKNVVKSSNPNQLLSKPVEKKTAKSINSKKVEKKQNQNRTVASQIMSKRSDTNFSNQNA